MMAVTRLAPVASLIAVLCVVGTHAQFLFQGDAATVMGINRVSDRLKTKGDAFKPLFTHAQRVKLNDVIADPNIDQEEYHYLSEVYTGKKDPQLLHIDSADGALYTAIYNEADYILNGYRRNKKDPYFQHKNAEKLMKQYLIGERNRDQSELDFVEWKVCNKTAVYIVYPAATGLTFTYNEAKGKCAEKQLSLPSMPIGACVVEFVHKHGGGTGWFAGHANHRQKALMFNSSIETVQTLTKQGLTFLLNGWRFYSDNGKMNTLVCVN